MLVMIVSPGIEGSGVPFLLTQGRAQTEERVLLGQVALDSYRCWRKRASVLSYWQSHRVETCTHPHPTSLFQVHHFLDSELSLISGLHNARAGRMAFCLKALPTPTPWNSSECYSLFWRESGNKQICLGCFPRSLVPKGRPEIKTGMEVGAPRTVSASL